MGRFTFSIDPTFIRQLGNMEDVERIAPKMIDGAMPILERNLKRAMEPHRDTGEMIRSVKTKKATMTKNGGFYAVTRPTGTDPETGVRNMEKFVNLEFGNSHQAATPMIDKVMNDSEKPVLNEMQEIFNMEMMHS